MRYIGVPGYGVLEMQSMVYMPDIIRDDEAEWMSGGDWVQGAEYGYSHPVLCTLLRVLESHHLPIFLLIHQCLQHELIEKVTRFLDFEMTNDR